MLQLVSIFVFLLYSACVESPHTDHPDEPLPIISPDHFIPFRLCPAGADSIMILDYVALHDAKSEFENMRFPWHISNEWAEYQIDVCDMTLSAIGDRAFARITVYGSDFVHAPGAKVPHFNWRFLVESETPFTELKKAAAASQGRWEHTRTFEHRDTLVIEGETSRSFLNPDRLPAKRKFFVAFLSDTALAITSDRSEIEWMIETHRGERPEAGSEWQQFVSPSQLAAPIVVARRYRDEQDALSPANPEVRKDVGVVEGMSLALVDPRNSTWRADWKADRPEHAAAYFRDHVFTKASAWTVFTTDHSASATFAFPEDPTARSLTLLTAYGYILIFG